MIRRIGIRIGASALEECVDHLLGFSPPAGQYLDEFKRHFKSVRFVKIFACMSVGTITGFLESRFFVHR